MTRVVLALALLVGCKDKPAPEAKPVVVAPTAVDDKLAQDIGKAVDDLQTMEPETISAADKAAAIAPTKLVGTWTIVHTVSITNGKRGEPSEPLVEGAWSFDDKGGYKKLGGNELSGTYVLTKDRLVIAALGPTLDYSVDKLTDTELVVTHMIMKDLGSTTTLKRK